MHGQFGISSNPPNSRHLARPRKSEMQVANTKQKLEKSAALRSASRYMCDRCCGIQWICGISEASIQHNAQEEPPASTQQREITFYAPRRNAQAILAQSPCRVCRLLGFYLSYDETETRRRRWDLQLDQVRQVIRFAPGVTSGADLHSRVYIHVTRLIEGDKSLDSLRNLFPPHLNLRLAKRWINNCRNTHRLCRLSRYLLRPESLKVIDCEKRIVVPLPSGHKYIALSYVWGEASNACENTSLESEGLPRTINHSILMTRKLGYRYLWIDRYCIDQKDTKNKHLQIKQMGMIYAAAELTIIAAAGADASYGLPGVIRQTRNLTRENLKSMQLTVVPPIFGLEDIGRSTWAARAWTFQEGFFSRRRLVFTDHQVHFICNTACESEVKQSSSPGLASQPQTYSKIPQWLSPKILRADQDPMMRAMEYLEQYSGRRLSYDEDALDAIVGALNVLNSDSVFHLWGVPVCNPVPIVGKSVVPPLQMEENGDSLSESSGAHCTRESKFALLWFHKKPAIRRAGFPSWSPIGWKSRISWYPLATASCEGFATSFKYTDSAPLLDFSHALAETEVSSQYLDVTLDVANLELVMHREFGRGYLPLSTLWSRLAPNQWLVKTSSHGRRDIPVPCFVFLFDDQTLVLYESYWDTDLPNKASNVTFKGILFKQDISNPTREQEDCVLVIENRGDHYERVGIFWFLPHTGHVFENDWGPEKYSHWQGSDMLDWEEKTYVNKGKWWRKFFKEERIRLG